MEKVNHTVQLYAQILTFLLVWVLVLFVSGIIVPIDLMTAIKSIPTAIGIYAFIGVVFVRWIWRWRIFQGWLIKIPDLQGTWRGELKSDWIDPNASTGIPSISIVLIIRQTFSSIKCTLMTAESSSYSTTANINTGPNGEGLFLSYNYTNRPRATLLDKSVIHDGAAILKIIKHPRLSLDGDYWTSRKTRGEMILYFASKTLSEQFSLEPHNITLPESK